MRRIYTVLLVAMEHAAISFMVTPIGWAIQDDSRFVGVDLVVWIVRAAPRPPRARSARADRDPLQDHANSAASISTATFAATQLSSSICRIW